MELTDGELLQLRKISGRIQSLQSFLASHPIPSDATSLQDWLTYLDNLKQIQGNTSNGMSVVATVLAKHYLQEILPIAQFDAAAKAQGASGLDIDTATTGGERVIGEIKTTTPYNGTDLGAKQKQEFTKDFIRLLNEEAVHKFFFVTDSSTFQYVFKRQAGNLPGVRVVFLTTGEEFDCQ